MTGIGTLQIVIYDEIFYPLRERRWASPGCVVCPSAACVCGVRVKSQALPEALGRRVGSGLLKHVGLQASLGKMARWELKEQVTRCHMAWGTGDAVGTQGLTAFSSNRPFADPPMAKTRNNLFGVSTKPRGYSGGTIWKGIPSFPQFVGRSAAQLYSQDH